MATLTPASASRFAAQPPEAPEPTTTTSKARPAWVCIGSLRPRRLPRAFAAGQTILAMLGFGHDRRPTVADEKRGRVLLHPSGVGRREILQGLFAGVGAGVALPAAAAAETAHHMAPAVAEAQAKAKAPGWKP